MFRDHFEFLKQFRSQFKTTGAIAPSSGRLARAMTRHVEARPCAVTPKPIHILEVGPGTGAVTRRIVRHLQPQDHLDLVELNVTFAALLRERFRNDSCFRPAAGQSCVHECGIETFRSDVGYDYVICGLPFNNFSPAFVGQVLAALYGLLAPGGILSYFEYMYVRPLRKMVAGSAERQRLQGLDDVFDPFLTQHRVGRDWVFLNVPPAWVQHVQRDPSIG